MKQTTDSYCDLQTADSPTVLVANDGTLISIIKVIGVNQLVGQEEYERIYQPTRCIGLNPKTSRLFSSGSL